MTQKISAVERISEVPSIIGIEGYSAKQVEEKLKKLAESQEQRARDRKELLEVLSKYPNPDHLSFQELLEQAIKNSSLTDDGKGYILDIGREIKREDGAFLDIKSKTEP